MTAAVLCALALGFADAAGLLTLWLLVRREIDTLYADHDQLDRDVRAECAELHIRCVGHERREERKRQPFNDGSA